jgi:hypothetical protein
MQIAPQPLVFSTYASFEFKRDNVFYRDKRSRRAWHTSFVISRECANDGATSQCALTYHFEQLGGSFNSPRRYCDGCFRAILEKTKADLDALLLATSK